MNSYNYLKQTYLTIKSNSEKASITKARAIVIAPLVTYENICSMAIVVLLSLLPIDVIKLCKEKNNKK